MLAENIEVREVVHADAAELTVLLNAIILKGGTTALEKPFTEAGLQEAYLTGTDVHCCFVAVDLAAMRIDGFQTLGRYSTLPDYIGDIGTFARIDRTQRGVGSKLFAATSARASALGLSAINATIRADNLGGLAFYDSLGFIDFAVMEGLPLNNGMRVDRVVKRYNLRSYGPDNS